MAKGGKSFQDRERSANVRNLALDIIEKVLNPNYEDKDYQKELVLRMASNLLPRLNEVTGAGGEALVIQISESIANKNAPNTLTK